jgi:Ca-activated chloride channel homolog
MKRSLTRRALSAWPLAFVAAAQDAVIRVNVRLVRLIVTVKDRAGQPVGTLQKSNFQVFDRNVAQEIAVFEHSTAQPLSVAVLIDISGSTGKDLKYEVTSVETFLKTLFGEGNAEDRAALYSFNWEVTRQLSFTRRLDRFRKPLSRLRPEAGTALYDAVYLAAQDLEDRTGRKVLIVVTDGGDTTSSHTFRQALEAVHAADAVVYPILVIPIGGETGRNVGGENALEMLAQGTGGRVFSPRGAAELDRSFTAILSDLRTQYLLGYYPKNLPESKDRFHPVRVELDRAAAQQSLQVLARNGYYGDAG